MKTKTNLESLQEDMRKKRIDINDGTWHKRVILVRADQLWRESLLGLRTRITAHCLLEKGWSLSRVAIKLQVDLPTLTAWDERRRPLL
jgi:hypothetical protein